MNPYSTLPDMAFWQRAVTQSPPGGLDPVVSSKFRIDATDKVATIGSCFAQHISRHLQRSGFNYFVTEQGDPGMSPEALLRHNYGVFSARYGNVYTARQARQVFDRAFGEFEPVDNVWEFNGRYVDPLRPRIEPDGFESVAALEQSRVEHLAAVRRMFTETDVLLFTLGLTEAWESLADHTVYPLAPGVSGGSFDEKQYRFVNFTVTEVIEDLERLAEGVRRVNPGVRIILTVSPVPISATYEPRHVVVSSTATKATLRVAADHMVRGRDWIDYFPGYEIVAGSPAGAQYYTPNMRGVSPVGVDHVMRVFARHVLAAPGNAPAPAVVRTAGATDTDLVCDEETIEASLQDAGAVSGNRDADPVLVDHSSLRSRVSDRVKAVPRKLRTLTDRRRK